MAINDAGRATFVIRAAVSGSDTSSLTAAPNEHTSKPQWLRADQDLRPAASSRLTSLAPRAPLASLPRRSEESAGQSATVSTQIAGGTEGLRLQGGPRVEESSSAAVARTARPAAHQQFVWPDGQASIGQPVPGRVANKPAYHFLLDPNDPVLSQGTKRISRERTAPHAALVRAREQSDGTFSAVMPSALEVGVTTTRLFSRDQKLADLKLPMPAFHETKGPAEDQFTLARMPLTKCLVTSDHLAKIVLTASGLSLALPAEQRGIVSALFARALEFLVNTDQAGDRVAMAHAARALKDTQHLMMDLRDGGRINSTIDAVELMAAADALAPGEHLYVAVSMLARVGHALGISISRCNDGTQNFDVSVLNSLGWQGESDLPVRTKRTSAEELNRALPMIMSENPGRQNPWVNALSEPAAARAPFTLDSDLLYRNNDFDKAMQWLQPIRGNPLLAWLNQHVAPDQEASFGPGETEVRQTPQKKNDCGIENAFAFLAAALHPADYKLAKASCLSMLQSVAEHLNQAGVAGMKDASKRLAERQKSALRGHALTQP